LFVAGLVLAVLVAGFGKPWNWRATWLQLGGQALLVAPWEAAWRRRFRLEHYETWLLQRIDECRRDNRNRPVHIIAHSYGSYLTGMVLRRHAVNRIRVNRVILVGSVLAEDFPWEELAAAGIFEQVRNEAGGRDIVVAMAGQARRICRELEFGQAGRSGFAASALSPVHDVRHPLEHCEHCFPPSQHRRRLVHNVKLPTFRHSDAFLVLERVDTFWLPWLCEREPWEFWDFRWLCVQTELFEDALNQNLAGPDPQRVEGLRRALIDQLKQRTWSWTQRNRPGVTFAQHVLMMIQQTLAAMTMRDLRRALDQEEEEYLLAEAADLVDDVIRVIRKRVADGHRLARDIRRRPRALAAEEERQLRSLDPVLAVLHAIQDTC
jgi:pimeloyl-ACP methyl ester carboxylesterase